MAYVEGLPRVSHIVSSVFPFEGEGKKRFEKWLKSKDISPEVYMNIANSYGTAIHKGMEDHINGEFLTQEQYEPHLSKYVSYGIQFLKEENVTPIETEHYIFVEDMYQGTIDLIGEIDGEQWVLDWKSYSCTQEILGIRKGEYKYRKPYDKLKKASLQLSLYAKSLGIDNIGVVELAFDGYHFHKLKRISDNELDIIIDNYYKNLGTKNGKILNDKSENIVFNEWLGAYDGVMSLSCKDCGQSVHLRSGLVILKNEQKEEYGTVTFYLEGGEVAINNRIIGNEKQ